MTLSIRLRLGLLFALGTAVLISVGGTIFVNEESGGLRNSVAIALEARAEYAMSAVANGHGLNGVFSERGAPNGPGQFAFVIDAEGALVSSAGSVPHDLRISAALRRTARLASLVLETSLRSHSASDDTLLYLTPVSRSSDILVIGGSLGTVDEAIDGVEHLLMFGGPLAVLLACVVGALIAGAALRPVERMRQVAADVTLDDEAFALPVPSTDDEIASLARTLNELLARLHDALGRQREFVAAASHELRSPLTNLTMELELAARPKRSPAAVLEALVAAREEVERLTRLCDSLLTLAQADTASSIVLPVHQAVEPVLRAAAESFVAAGEQNKVSIDVKVDELSFAFDEVALTRICANLLDNALRFAPPGSTVRLLGRIDESTSRYVVEIVDDGVGFPAEFLGRAFERFSRPDAARDRQHGGVGLGLALVRALAEAHGGTAEVSTGPSGGGWAAVFLPAV